MIWGAAILPALAGLALWAADLRSGRTMAGLAAVALLATGAVAALAGPGEIAWSDALSLRAEFTPLSRAVALTVPIVAIAIIVFATAHEEARGRARLTGLLLVFTGAMELAVIAGDLVTLLIGWELMGACSWALIGHRWRDPAAMPSAGYAFVMTRAGDLGLFVALFVTLAATGRADYAALGALDGAPLGIAAAGILIAAAAKAGQLPFSPWLFRAMDGPTPVSALLHSSTMVAAGAYLLARLHPWLAEAPGFASAAIAVGLLTALAGGVIAAAQMHAKKLLAASTSAQLGLMFAATGAGYPGIAVLHLIAHAALKAPLFFAAGIAGSQAGGFDLRRMRLGRALPWIAAATALPVLALAGVPPLGAAWSKEKILAAATHHAMPLGVIVAVAGGLSAAYAARFWIMAFCPGDGPRRAAPSGEAWPLACLALATLALSAIWLPAVEAPVLRALGIDAPEGAAWEFALSLMLVAAGLGAGVFLARMRKPRRWDDWFGLPGLIEAGVIRPTLNLATRAGRWDDRVIDGALVGGATAAGGVATRLADADRRGRVDIAAPIARATLAASRAAARSAADPASLAARAANAAARAGADAGERAADRIATGTGALARLGAAQVRRLQSGMAHHYYLFLVLSAVAAILLLTLGA